MMAKLVKLLGTLGSTDVLAVAKDPTRKGPETSRAVGEPWQITHRVYAKTTQCS